MITNTLSILTHDPHHPYMFSQVGWMFSCPSREGMEEPLSAHELLLAADQQLEACKGNVDEVMALSMFFGANSLVGAI